MTTEVVRSQFGAVAAAYATSTYHASGPDLQALVRAAGLVGSERVLDVGCGAGHTAIALAPYAAQVTAVDVTPDMLATARALAEQRGVSGITFRHADAAQLPFEPEQFDVVCSRVAAHHFADPRAALAEMRRVLRPGGRLVVVDAISPEAAPQDTFLNCIELLRDASHVRDWRVSEWLGMLEQAGFAEASVLERFTLWLDGPDWVTRMRTPSAKVAMLRQLFAEATPAQRETFEIRSNSETDWGFGLGLALFGARR